MIKERESVTTVLPLPLQYAEGKQSDSMWKNQYTLLKFQATAQILKKLSHFFHFRYYLMDFEMVALAFKLQFIIGQGFIISFAIYLKIIFRNTFCFVFPHSDLSSSNEQFEIMNWDQMQRHDFSINYTMAVFRRYMLKLKDQVVH